MERNLKMPKFAERDKLYTYILTTILTLKTDMSMDKDIVRKFMENFGPDGVPDACILWLIRKNRLYFQVFSQDVVRWLLLLFGKKSIEDPQVTQWLNERYNEDIYKHIISNLWSNYCQYSGTEYTQFELKELNAVKSLLRVTQLERKYLSTYQKSELRHALKIYYDEIFPLIICARKVVFEKQFDIHEVSKAIECDFSELDTLQAKENYIKTIFENYHESLFNKIQTHLEPLEQDCSIRRTSTNHIVSDSRHSIFAKTYNNYDSYVRSVRREQQSMNGLLCMITTTQPALVSPTTSDVVLNQLGAFANPLSQINEAFNVLLASSNIVFKDIKEKYGINIDVQININFPNSTTAQSSSQHNPLPIISIDGSLQLPIVLDTPKARVVFKKAMDKGLIVPSSVGKLSWIGLDFKGKLAQLAYLCEIIYEGNYDLRGNHGKNVPFKDLEELFGVKKLSSTLQQLHDAKRVQAWRAAIDELCK